MLPAAGHSSQAFTCLPLPCQDSKFLHCPRFSCLKRPVRIAAASTARIHKWWPCEWSANVCGKKQSWATAGTPACRIRFLSINSPRLPLFWGLSPQSWNFLKHHSLSLPHFIYPFVYVWCAYMCDMWSHKYMYVHMGTRGLLDFSPLHLLRQGLSLDPELADLATLAASLAQELLVSTCGELCLQELHHDLLCGSGDWTPIPMLAPQTLYPLGSPPSSYLTSLYNPFYCLVSTITLEDEGWRTGNVLT